MPNQVPTLNLAPTLKRPLSLTWPPDYLRLLYWCFFFPQAVRWYVETFSAVGFDYDNITNDARTNINTLRTDSVQRNLLIQSQLTMMFITPMIALLLSFGLQTLGYPIDENRVLGGSLLGILFGVVFGLLPGVFGHSLFGVFGGLLGGLITGVVFGLFGDSLFSIRFGIFAGVLVGVAGSVFVSLFLGVFGGFLFSVPTGIVFGIFLGGIAYINGNTANVIVFFLIYLLCLLLTHTRWLDYVLTGWLSYLSWNKKDYWRLSRVTYLPIPSIYGQLQQWLKQDSAIALANINQLMAYSFQMIPIFRVVHQWLNSLEEQHLIPAINQLAEHRYLWEIIRQGDKPWYKTFMEIIYLSFILLPYFVLYQDIYHQQLNRLFKFSKETPINQCCAGYYFLYQARLQNINSKLRQQYLEKASQAFAQVRQLPHGNILYHSTIVLHTAYTCHSQADILRWLATFKSLQQALQQADQPPLRPKTINTLRRLHQIALEINIAEQSVSKLNRSAALNRALGELTTLIGEVEEICPFPEWPIVKTIAEQWREIIGHLAGQIGEQVLEQPVVNPFVAGTPVSGNLFVGRDEIYRQLEELWGNQPRKGVNSVVLYGHRRMGKTSILQNLGQHRFGLQTIVAHYSAQGSAMVLNTPALLTDMAFAIYDALEDEDGSPNLAEPDEDGLTPTQFKRFLRQVEKELGPNRRLIFTLDEFEQLEALIEAGRIEANLLTFLRDIIHNEPWFIMALAGLHTLEEMTMDYWNPLYASVTPIKVSFLSWQATADLLGNPHDSFTLDFTRQTIDAIYAQVQGQPYLTQLIGQHLVNQYNHTRFDLQQPHEPRFTAADVTAVLHKADFYLNGRYYFNGVWNQAKDSAPAGQLTILLALAQADGPLSLEALLAQTKLTQATLQAALTTLQSHDAITYSATTGYRFTVPLMRRWVREFREVGEEQ